MLPWLAPIMIGILAAALLEDTPAPWRWLGLAIALPSGIGAIYAVTTYVIVGLGTDIRRHKERQRNDRSAP